MRLKIPRNIVINFAGMAFLGVVIFLAWENAAIAQLFSVPGLLFVVIGLLLSGAVIGWPLTRIHRHYCMKIIEGQQGDLTPRAMQTIRFTGTFVMLLQLIAVYYLADWGFSHFFKLR